MWYNSAFHKRNPRVLKPLSVTIQCVIFHPAALVLSSTTLFAFTNSTHKRTKSWSTVTIPETTGLDYTLHALRYLALLWQHTTSGSASGDSSRKTQCLPSAYDSPGHERQDPRIQHPSTKWTWMLTAPAALFTRRHLNEFLPLLTCVHNRRKLVSEKRDKKFPECKKIDLQRNSPDTFQCIQPAPQAVLHELQSAVTKN
jgi:hypothetical protein